MAATGDSKLAALQRFADEQNRYLAEHPLADEFTAWKKVSGKDSKLNLSSILRIPKPSLTAKELLDALDVKLPLFLQKSKARVDTKRKRPSRIKS
jgi:hypothetical protein